LSSSLLQPTVKNISAIAQAKIGVFIMSIF
jgi:hypothetical protein